MGQQELIKYLQTFVTGRRAVLFDKVLSKRTRYITVLLEDIYQPHNASAVLRTCDCFGIQDVNIIENRNIYEVNPDVTLGSDKWLTINKFNKTTDNTGEAYKTLRQKGYRIVATGPHGNEEVSLNEYDLKKGKFALVFGTEMHGLSNMAVNEADEYLKIPMFGFTESFNISVSAAIILYDLTCRLRKSDISWQLTDHEKLELKLEWLKKSVRKADCLEKKFLDGKDRH